jgi:bacterioferritin
MERDERVAMLLNEVLKAQLTAANQYFLHSVMCDKWGFVKLAAQRRAASVHRMNHAQSCLELILASNGTPAIDELFPMRVGLTVRQQIENDLAMHIQGIPRLHNAIQACAELDDTGSREVLQKILLTDESDVDLLEAELHTIREIGIDDYLAAQVH